MKDVIKDFNGRIIGYVEELSNKDKRVTDFYGRVIGYYRKRDNTTRDFYNRIVARGDQVGILFIGR